jgi:hypothetical protein
VTYRLGDHTTADDARRYRRDEEVKAAWQREPLTRLRTWLAAEGVGARATRPNGRKNAAGASTSRSNAYLATRLQPLESMFDHLYADMPADLAAQRARRWPGKHARRLAADGRAHPDRSHHQALAWELTHDESVLILGEDVGVNGGVFRATAGLQQRFGAERVLDTPLDETTIAGLSVGLAAQGMKPVAEVQFDGFVYPMLDHIICHAARMRTRTRGRLTCPMVLRVPWGGGIRAPEHHSEANESMFTNVPGLRVVMPSSPARAYGLLLAAIRDPDPGDLLRTQAHLSPIQGRGAGRWRSAAARCLLRAARRQRRDPGDLGRAGQGNAGSRGRPGHARHQRPK